MIILSALGCLVTVASAMRLITTNNTRDNIPDCAESCYYSAAHAVGCATENQIECRCGTSEDQRVRIAAAQCYRANCEMGTVNDAMRFADLICVSSGDTQPTEIAGDDQEELDDMLVAPTLSVTTLPEDEKQRGTETGSAGESAPSTLLSITTGYTPAKTGPPSLTHVEVPNDEDDDSDAYEPMTAGAQAGIALGAIMCAIVLGLSGYLVIVRIRKARKAKATGTATVEGGEPTRPGLPQPQMSELCGGGGHGVAPDSGNVDGEWKKKGQDEAGLATELETARSPPPQYARHELFVEPVELDSRPVEARPTMDDDEITPIQARP